VSSQIHEPAVRQNLRQNRFRYLPLLADENEEIEAWLIALTKARKNWGFGLCYLYLRNIKGFKWILLRKRFHGRILASFARFIMSRTLVRVPMAPKVSHSQACKHALPCKGKTATKRLH
jgi:hypothetical protein